MTPIQEYYGNEDNCYKDIGLARKVFGDTRTTRESYDAMEKGLGLMLLYCPDHLYNIVHITLQESTMRRFYFEKRWRENGRS